MACCLIGIFWIGSPVIVDGIGNLLQSVSLCWSFWTEKSRDVKLVSRLASSVSSLDRRRLRQKIFVSFPLVTCTSLRLACDWLQVRSVLLISCWNCRPSVSRSSPYTSAKFPPEIESRRDSTVFPSLPMETCTGILMKTAFISFAKYL